MAKRTSLQGKQREGALEMDIRWVGREEHSFQARPTFHNQWVVFALWTVVVSVIPVKWRVCSHCAQWKLRGPILTVQIQTPHCWVDPSQGQNTQGHWAELALLCAPTNLAEMSTFTHSPHHTVTLDPLQNSYPEPRDLPHFFHALWNFCFQDPILAGIPEFPISLPKHTRACTLFWFLLLLWSSVLFQSCCHFI